MPLLSCQRLTQQRCQGLRCNMSAQQSLCRWDNVQTKRASKARRAAAPLQCTRGPEADLEWRPEQFALHQRPRKCCGRTDDCHRHPLELRRHLRA